MRRYTEVHKHRNYLYTIEKKEKNKWILDWDCGAYTSYNVAEQIMKDFEKYNKHPGKYRIVMYISEKPHDE